MTDFILLGGAGDLIDQMRPGDGGTNGAENGAENGQAITLDPSQNGDTLPVVEDQDGGFFGTWGFILLWGAVFAGMWFFLIRPQRNREKKMKEMQAAIGTGENVVTSGGLFGKVADVGEDCFLVDFGTNRTVRIPVLKADVVGVRSPKMTPQPKEMPKDKETE